MWKIYALLSALFAALTAILAKLGVAGVNSNVATAVRTLVVLFIASAIIFVSGEAKYVKTLTKENWLFLTLSGIATGLSWLFYFKAIQLGEVSKVAPIDKLSIALTILLSFLVLREPLESKTILGGLLILAGTLTIIWH